MGRPSLKTTELVATICERLAMGEPLAAICRDEGMPHPSTVRDWMAADETVSRAIARAREDGEDWLAAECLEIADDGSRDYETKEDGREVVDHDHIQRSKLRIDTRLKLLSKWNPKKYGERLALAGDPEAPVQVEATVTLEPGDAYLRMLNGG
jgi:transposase-like protein